MKYVNASEILPEELLEMVRKYYRRGYLYISRGNEREAGQADSWECCIICPNRASGGSLQKKGKSIVRWKR